MLVFLKTPNRHQSGRAYRIRLYDTKMGKIDLIFTTRLILRYYTDGHKGVLDESGGKQHNITQTDPNGLERGERGQRDESWPSPRWLCRGVFVRHQLRSKQIGSEFVSPSTVRISAGEAFQRNGSNVFRVCANCCAS